MLQLFLESLLSGTLLATLYFGGSSALRMLAGRRPQALPAGEALRCVQPLDLAQH